MIWSYILEYENMQNPYEDRRSNTMEWKAVAAIEIMESEDIISAAETLQIMGIKTKDSLHIACAVAGNADYFLTTDKRLLNSADSVSDVKIRNPLEFISTEE
jgi:predicted nucleic acid-binding protein